MPTSPRLSEPGLPDKPSLQTSVGSPVVHHGCHPELPVESQGSVSRANCLPSTPAEIQRAPMPRHLSPHREIERGPMIRRQPKTFSVEPLVQCPSSPRGYPSSCGAHPCLVRIWRRHLEEIPAVVRELELPLGIFVIKRAVLSDARRGPETPPASLSCFLLSGRFLALGLSTEASCHSQFLLMNQSPRNLGSDPRHSRRRNTSLSTSASRPKSTHLLVTRPQRIIISSSCSNDEPSDGSHSPSSGSLEPTIRTRQHLSLRRRHRTAPASYPPFPRPPTTLNHSCLLGNLAP